MHTLSHRPSGSVAVTIAIISAMMAAGLPIGCTPQKVDDPIAVMLDRQQGFPQRRAAAEQAEQQLGNDPKRIAALNQLVWERGYPDWQRRYAIDQLIAIDEADFRSNLARRIVLIQNWETLDYIFKLAVDHQWDDFTPTAVRQYARPAHGIPDDQRPERAVIQKLNPSKTIEQVVFEVFVNAEDKISTTEQAAAWELLCRIVSQNELLTRLAEAPERSALIVDLKACAVELHTIPVNREGILWLSHLRDPSRADTWSQMRTAIGRLSDEQRRSVALRHLAVLLRLDEGILALSRAQLLDKVRSYIEAGEHHLKGPEYDGPMRNYPQRFAEAADKLCWGDLATIHLMFRAIADRSVVASLFAQADADLADTSSEHGGVIDIEAGAFKAIAYKPGMRVHDLKFIASDAMITRLYTSLGHYHFHAQDHKHADYAGPGVGDLKFADRLNFSCLVLTFINRDKLNVDYYQPGGAVVDLGVIHR